LEDFSKFFLCLNKMKNSNRNFNFILSDYLKIFLIRINMMKIK
jgi:hypothetical protein